MTSARSKIYIKWMEYTPPARLVLCRISSCRQTKYLSDKLQRNEVSHPFPFSEALVPSTERRRGRNAFEHYLLENHSDFTSLSLSPTMT